MKDTDIDSHLTQFLPSGLPAERFKKKVLADSMNEFIRHHRRRSIRRNAMVVAAAVFIACVSFAGGRFSVSSTLPRINRGGRTSYEEPGSVSVSKDLVAWLNAAQLFRQLGMQDRMARSVDRAARFLPNNTGIADNQTMAIFAADFDSRQEETVNPTDPQGPRSSIENINGILSQTFPLEIEK